MTALANENARTLHAKARFSARMRGRSRESAISGENVRRLHARARFQARMRGRSTRERHFQRECEDVPRESAIFSENVFSHLGPPTLNIRRMPGLLFLHLGPPTLNIRRTPGLVFLHLGPPTLNIGRTLGLPFLHLGPPTLHVGSRFCMSDHRIPCMHTYIPTYIHTNKQTYIHTHAYIHTYGSFLKWGDPQYRPQYTIVFITHLGTPAHVYVYLHRVYLGSLLQVSPSKH